MVEMFGGEAIHRGSVRKLVLRPMAGSPAELLIPPWRALDPWIHGSMDPAHSRGREVALLSPL
jgi:hypothetical protein